MTLPKDVKITLWSYDIAKADPKKDAKVIIAQVLNWGNFKAITWIFKYYGKRKIKKVASDIPIGQWNKKSLALWKVILNINPKERKTRIK